MIATKPLLTFSAKDPTRGHLRREIAYNSAMETSKPVRDLPVWLGRRGDSEPDPYAGMTIGERVALVWPLTLTAWEFAGKPVHESRLPRDVDRVIRRER
jgi:hypothetical protein